MNITVLAYNLIGSGGLSVGRNITALLPKIGPQHKYLMLVPENLEYDLHIGSDNVVVKQIKRMSFLERVKFDLIILPKLVKDFNSDIVLALGNIGLSNCPCKQAVLIHQSQIVYNSKHFGKMAIKDSFRIWAVKQRVKKCLKTTNLIFCQTPVVRDRFAREMNYPISKIKIMPNAVSVFAKDVIGSDKADAVFNDTNKFNLFLLSRYMPHKNFEILIDLFSKYRNELKEVRCIITIEAEHHKNSKKLLENIHKYNLQDNIVNVGPLKQEELGSFFKGCDAFLFPTLLESFSGTYLEAMHFGLPILTSDLDFARYVCYDSALYFNPWDSKDILDKILYLKNNPDIAKNLKEKGSNRIKLFFRDWQDIVKDVLKEVEKL